MSSLIPVLLVGWKGTPESNPAPHLVDHYVLCIQRITPEGDTMMLNGEEIKVTKCETIARTRMNITEGRKLVAAGMRPGAAWFTEKPHRKRKHAQN